jgi:hypothetical protein
MVPLAKALAQNAAICAHKKRHQQRAMHAKSAHKAAAAHLTVTPQLA